MADELKIPLDPFTDTGLTLLGKVYNSTGAQEGSTVSMSEDGPALYIGDFDVTTRNDGQYVVRFETNTPDKLYGTGSLYIRDGKEVSPEMYFNQALDTVANVTTVATTTTNTDMRGTDNALLAASYTAPDNAGITNNGNAIGALNDFNPATDTVANVTLVATTTTNTDMRGTDGANTVTPDNAGITANGNAIAALNNFNPASDQVIVATNNDKTGYSISGTKNTLDDLNDVSASDVYAEFTTGSNEDVFKADVSNLDVAVSTRNSVAPDNAGITANGNAIAALNDISAADVDTELTNNHGSGSWQSAAGTINANVISVDGNTVNSADDFKADVSGLSTFDASSETVTTDTASREASKADLSDVGTRDNQSKMYEGTKRSAGLKPVKGDLPDS